jgi:pyruvate/2-oxoglutarate dehydrogenase complex dihydrolipoamide acyltransferase (E2) component
LVKTQNPVSGTRALYGNPDLHPLCAIEPLTDVKPPALILRDMTGARITGIDTGIGAFPVVTIIRSVGKSRLALDYPPEAAILGITRTGIQPVWDGETFVPAPMVPLDLSYDHRVINGADAARFLAYHARLIADPRQLLI